MPAGVRPGPIVRKSYHSRPPGTRRQAATATTPPVEIELSEAQYLVLLKHARNSSCVAARLLSGEAQRGEHQRGPSSVVSASLCARMFLSHSIT